MMLSEKVNRKQCLILTFTNILMLVAYPQALEASSGHVAVVPIPRPSPAPAAPPPENHELLVFADLRLEIVYPVIQNFKSLITSDPFNITASWVGSDICSYRGFYCESPPDNGSALALASIDFNGFQLAAPTLDGFLDQLPDIALFHANSNYFAGTISLNIAKLTWLYEFDISNNKFSGPFPPAILAMGGLSFLDIRFNSFSGSVPPQLFTKGSLDALFLNNNNFRAKLPYLIGSSNHIIYLTLANNKFFGPIPPTISSALSENLTEFLLLNNQLSGCLPYELGLLRQVVVFDARSNRLTGPLPYSLGCLQNLEILNFAGNLLYGHVPEVLCRLGNLANLSLSDNYFTSFGPSCWSLIEDGILDLENNCILGLPFQRSVAECWEFFTYYPLNCPHLPVHTHIPCGLPHWTTSGFGRILDLAPSPSI